jgi:hypothetical protein
MTTQANGSREAFEAWVKSTGRPQLARSQHHDGYRNANEDAQWVGWQAALETRAAELVGWMPIDSCPVGESVLLGKWVPEDGSWYWITSGEYENDSIFCDFMDDGYVAEMFRKPSHWMPLPSAPTNKGADAGVDNGDDAIYLAWCQTLIKALKRLSFAAQTSGGTAGRDEELIAAIDEAEKAMSLSAAADALNTTPPEPAQQLVRGVWSLAQDIASEFAVRYAVKYTESESGIAAYARDRIERFLREHHPQNLGADAISRESRMVVIERNADGLPTVWCDPEIADIVAALNSAGIKTVASCSGHGHRPAQIAMADGREIMIVNSEDAKALGQLWPTDINGVARPNTPAQSKPGDAGSFHNGTDHVLDATQMIEPSEKAGELVPVAWLNTKYRTLFHASEIAATNRNSAAMEAGELIRLYTADAIRAAERRVYAECAEICRVRFRAEDSPEYERACLTIMELIKDKAEALK